jgi:hypothetical protein
MTPALTAIADEASELFCDKAEGILREALESENETRRDVASRFVLSGKGALRGWSRRPESSVTGEEPPRTIVIKWLDAPPVAPGGVPALIDARPADGGDEPFSEE